MARESGGVSSGLLLNRPTLGAGLSRPARTLWRLLSASMAVAGLALLLFHVWLFWDQWHVGRLADPLVAAKWAGSLLLVTALAVCHRRGLPLFRGRRALVLWTLAAVLHVGADHPGSAVTPETASAVLFVLPTVAAASLVAAALLLVARRSRMARGPAPRTTVRPASRARRPAPLLAAPPGLRAPPVPAV